MDRKAVATAIALAVAVSFAHGASAAVLLSDLISSGGVLTAGDLSFGGFQTTPQDTVDPTTVDVSLVTDALGRAGVAFSSPLTIGSGGGSKEIVSDILFTVTETNPGSVLESVTQSFSASVSGSGITAFDFTRAGSTPATLATLAANCVNGDVSGCPQIASPTDMGLLGGAAGDEIEREVQLVRGRGGVGTGELTSWEVVFGEAPAITPLPEPSTWLLATLGVGMAGAAFRRRRRPKRVPG